METTNMRNESKTITTDPINIKMIIKENYKLYAPKFDI